jgi:peptidyl-tRNA hydrolase
MFNQNDIPIKLNIKIAEENGLFDNEDQYIMYILVNNDLKMDINKVIRFCCDSLSQVIIENERASIRTEAYIKWLNNNEKKVILKAKETDLLYCVNNFSDINSNIWCKNILELGQTSVSPFSLTTVAFTPMLRKNTPDIIQKLKEL